MPTTKSRPGDLTGRVRDTQNKKYADELEARAEEIGLATAARKEEILTEVTDFTQPLETVIPDFSPTDFTDSDGLESDELEELEETDPWQVIFMYEDLDQCTIGAGNTRDYKVGQKYKVTKHVATHLIEKGYAR